MSDGRLKPAISQKTGPSVTFSGIFLSDGYRWDGGLFAVREMDTDVRIFFS